MNEAEVKQNRELILSSLRLKMGPWQLTRQKNKEIKIQRLKHFNTKLGLPSFYPVFYPGDLN